MANQSPDRRQALEMIAMATAASQFRGFSRWVCAPQHTVEDSVPSKPHMYTPQFFSAPEFETLDQLTERILPRDETPGAKDAGVAEFIDFMAANDKKIQRPLRDGLQKLNAHATQMHGAVFAGLTQDRQNQLLHGLVHDNFFRLVRRYTVMGYYTSRIGLEQLSYPGLKFYSASPACQHTSDPEHKHLPPPRV